MFDSTTQTLSKEGGLSLSEVAKCLGSGNTDLGSLCTHKNINMWSKYKPVQSRSLFGEDYEGVPVWKGGKGDCGINLDNARTDVYTNIPSLYTDDGVNGWVYERPTGGEASPFRLSDFDGYKHDAQAPVQGFSVPDKVAQGGKLRAMIMSFAVTGGDNEPRGLHLSDIGTGMYDLSTYKLGLIVYDDKGALKGRVVGSDPSSCLYDVSHLILNKSYKVYPVLAKESLEQDTDDSYANIWYTLPGVAPAEFRVTSYEEAIGLTIDFAAVYVYESGVKSQIRVTLNVAVEESSYIFENNSLEVRFSTSTDADGLERGEERADLGTITITSTAPVEIVKTFDYFDKDRDYVAKISLDNGHVTRTIQIMEQIVRD